jgi:hypothetical protein
MTDLEGLIDLDPRGGVDMRPTLLRVLTDLYLQKPAHSPNDERYYAELALRLIEATGTDARAALAARLARYPAAPRDVILRLARDVVEVAEPILAHSRALTPGDLAEIGDTCGPAHAAAIAARTLDATQDPPETAAAPRTSDPEAVELSELFYAADSIERRLILINLEFAAWMPAAPAAALERKDVWRLEAATLQHNLDAVVREFERALGISHLQARRIIEDELGEPIVVAAKALTLPSDVLQRMLLFVNPHIGQSIERVYELAGLYGEITVDAARRLIALLRDADPADYRAPRYESPAWRNAAENARRALSEIARRPAGLPLPGLRRPAS